MNAARHWGVVGGGMLGLTLAHRLAQQGQRVTVFEAAPQLGGLASAWQLEDVVWDRHYHVTLLSDTRLRGLLAELALEQDMNWVETRTGCYADGTLHSVSDTLEFLRFPPLQLLDKLRLGATIFYGSKVRNWRRLEEVPVAEWLSRWSGRRTFERFWLPLLRAKLGDSYRDASAAFIWATIQRLYAARRTGLKKELFGYVPGGYARILARFAEVLAAEDVDVRVGAPVAAVEPHVGHIVVREQGGATRHFDDVIVTANPAVAARLLPNLRASERHALERVRYQGIVCASLLLKRPLSDFYLTYITDEAPFTAVVEMTAFVDPSHFGGRSLVYLPKYCTPDDPIAQLDDAALETLFVDALQRMYPQFDASDVVSFRVSRVREVFAVPTIGYSRHVPARATSLTGVHLVNSSQIVNGTLNVNETVQLAERAVEELLGQSRHELTEAKPRPSQLTTEHAAAGHTVAGVRPHNAPADVHRARRPVATLSVDLDDLWSYLQTKGDSSWQALPTFLDRVVPRALLFFDNRQQPVTWFVVGKDAVRPQHRDLLRSIADAGHEIGNHSFSHEPWLHRHALVRIEDEIARADEAIREATGHAPAGFRGPGYSLSKTVLEVLERRGYRYDASTLPTFIGPLARAFYARGNGFTSEQRARRDDLFGTVWEGTRPLRPYRWRLDGEGLVEVPVTTMPLLRTPIHMSYLMYLAEISPALARRYLAVALRLCRTTGVAPSLLLHSHDFIGADDVPAMAFFPGFRLAGAAKVDLVSEAVDQLRASFDVMPIGNFVEQLGSTRTVEPRFHKRPVASGVAVPAGPSGGDDR